MLPIKTTRGKELLNISEPWTPDAAFPVLSIVDGLLFEGKRKEYRKYVIAMIEFARGNAESDEYKFIPL